MLQATRHGSRRQVDRPGPTLVRLACARCQRWHRADRRALASPIGDLCRGCLRALLASSGEVVKC